MKEVVVLILIVVSSIVWSQPMLQSQKQLAVFKENGCANCHNIHKVSEFTDYGKWARDRGYGCINLLSLIKLHNIKGPALERAKEVFVQNKCSVCHEVSGKGVGKENLTSYGVKIKREQLGCTALYKALLKE
ncbi:MAG: c-type cytochrome [Hydrogenobacter sp.]